MIISTLALSNLLNKHFAASGMWNLPERYISSTEGKFSGFLSKKYSGGCPGLYSSQSCKISSMLSELTSLPSLVFGYFRIFFREHWNFSPPTSKTTYCRGLATSDQSNDYALDLEDGLTFVKVVIHSFPRILLSFGQQHLDPHSSSFITFLTMKVSSLWLEIGLSL